MRVNYLDAERGALMSLGVVLHAATIYDRSGRWKINDPHGLAFFHWLRTAIHVFRMPAFFMISGFFCLMALRRYGRDFLRVRLVRLVIPMLSTAILLNTLQAYAIYLHSGDHGTFMHFYMPYGWREFISSDRWVSHLWFLIDLTIYTLVAYVAYQALTTRRTQIDALLLRVEPALKSPFAFFILAFAGACGQMLSEGVTHFANTRVLVISDVFEYAMYFLLGVYMYYNAAVFERFTNVSKSTVLAIVIAGIGLGILQPLEQRHGVWILEFYLNTVLSVAICVILFHAFKRFASRPNKVVKYFADASYTVYLFHHCVVIVLGIVLMKFSLPVPVKFFLLVISTMAVVIAIHECLILRFKLLRFLFNGKYESEPAEAFVGAPTS